MALERLHFADGDRKALLIFTDGDDSRSMGFGSEMNAGDAIEAARLTDAVVYAIGFEGNGARVNKRFLRRLTEETGGQALFPERTGDLISSFARIEADMHAQYRLAYIPREAERDGEWREIEVSVRGRRDLLARTRNGYYAFPRRGVTPSRVSQGVAATGSSAVKQPARQLAAEPSRRRSAARALRRDHQHVAGPRGEDRIRHRQQEQDRVVEAGGNLFVLLQRGPAHGALGGRVGGEQRQERRRRDQDEEAGTEHRVSPSTP